jgi:hypothetical protein
MNYFDYVDLHLAELCNNMHQRILKLGFPSLLVSYLYTV